MVIENYTPDDLFKPIGAYSHFSKAGNIIHISGTPAVNPQTGLIETDNAYDQAKQILLNFQTMLKSANADLKNILHIHVFLKNVDDFQEMNRGYMEFFDGNFPARTVIVVADLPKQGALMTMNAMAVVSE
ncbi:RidA family protein [Moraxella equi]|uniref:2-aminomuconate deaminase n=1 Tax=Moraxella equi TaxID=60442 RepID=A0A378QP15_9GAMM|nr:RidA family protein [Moraxella equi]MDO5051149.1 RidA family protein [Moraxella equi]OPH34127.1 reactive intermediate/imine deaminase [Moraxella equi]STZ02222.1 2-aminomuconate deaminase [Moraxella equi]